MCSLSGSFIPSRPKLKTSQIDRVTRRQSYLVIHSGSASSWLWPVSGAGWPLPLIRSEIFPVVPTCKRFVSAGFGLQFLPKSLFVCTDGLRLSPLREPFCGTLRGHSSGLTLTPPNKSMERKIDLVLRLATPVLGASSISAHFRR